MVSRRWGWALVLATGSCVLPLPEHESSNLPSRSAIPSEELSGLVDARATRAEVLLRLGEPECVLDEERVLVYVWQLSAGWVGDFASAQDLPTYHFAFLVFDPDGRLARCDAPRMKVFQKPGDVIDRWLEENGTAPTAH